MLYENELHELAENLESDLYILPSSVHEVLAVSTELTDPEELAQMVAEVNMQRWHWKNDFTEYRCITMIKI